jgi:hypothetical protein
MYIARGISPGKEKANLIAILSKIVPDGMNLALLSSLHDKGQREC